MSNLSDWVEATGTWVAAVGTVTAVSVALWQARSERNERLERERRERNEREDRDRRERNEREKRERREHATRISAWPGPRGDIQLMNTSDEPVHEVVVFPVFIQGAAPSSGEDWMRFVSDPKPFTFDLAVVFGALLPGRWRTPMPAIDTGIMQGRLGAEIAFSDRSGNHWIRRANGELKEIESNAIDYYGVERPINYIVPDLVGPN